MESCGVGAPFRNEAAPPPRAGGFNGEPPAPPAGLLRGAPRPAGIARQQVAQGIARFNRVQVQPTRDQLEHMARALDEGAALDTERVRMLRFLMKGYA